jgi:hypothetical protein
MVTAWRGVDLALVRHVLAPFGPQVAVWDCPFLGRSDGRNPNLDGLPALDHLSVEGRLARSVTGFCCRCGSMVWSGCGAEQRNRRAVRPVRLCRPARPVRSGSGYRIGPAFAGCGGQRLCPGRKRQDARPGLAGGPCDDAGRRKNHAAAPSQARHRCGGANTRGKPVSSTRPARGKSSFGLHPGQGAMAQGRRPDAAGPDNRKTSICWKLIRMAPAAVSNGQRPRKNASPTRQRCGGM